jgi:hypothetical protein
VNQEIKYHPSRININFRIKSIQQFRSHLATTIPLRPNLLAVLEIYQFATRPLWYYYILQFNAIMDDFFRVQMHQSRQQTI